MSSPLATGSVASDAVLPVLRRIIADSGVLAGESVDLVDCPAGDLRQLAAAGPAEVLSIAGSAQDPYSFVFQPDIAGEFPLINCVMDLDSYESGVGIGMGEAIDDFENDLSVVLPEFIVTIEASTAHLGGTIVRLCAEPIGVDGDLRPLCEADWYDDNSCGSMMTASCTTVRRHRRACVRACVCVRVRAAQKIELRSTSGAASTVVAGARHPQSGAKSDPSFSEVVRIVVAVRWSD
jgi:hypothetical protein